MSNLRFDYGKAGKFLEKREVEAMEPFIAAAHKMLHGKTCPGSDF